MSVSECGLGVTCIQSTWLLAENARAWPHCSPIETDALRGEAWQSRSQRAPQM